MADCNGIEGFSFVLRLYVNLSQTFSFYLFTTFLFVPNIYNEACLRTYLQRGCCSLTLVPLPLSVYLLSNSTCLAAYKRAREEECLVVSLLAVALSWFGF